MKGVNDDDVGGGRAILRFQPTDKLTIDANYTTQTETSGGSSRYTPAGTTAFNNDGRRPSRRCRAATCAIPIVTQSPWSDNLVVFGTTLTYDTGVGTMTGTANQYDRRTGFTFDSTPILVSYGVPVPAETFEPRDREVTSSELRYASAFDSPVNFVAGVYREHEHQLLDVDVLTTNGFGLPTGPFCTNNSCDALIVPRHRHHFLRAHGRAVDDVICRLRRGRPGRSRDAWTAVAGIRYFTESLEGVQIQTHPFGGFPGSPTLVPLPDPNETFNKVTWKANLSYKFNESLLAYGTVSTGFRSGGLNAVSEPFEPIPAAYAPDSLINFELGAKGRLFDGLFDYQADVYFIRWSNIQVQETTPDGAFVYQGNAGEAKVKGVEFEFTAHPIQYLSASFAGSYQDAYLTQGASAAQYALNPTLGLTGDAIPNVPKYQASLGLNYTAADRERLGWHGGDGCDLSGRGEFLFRLQFIQHSAGPLHAGGIADGSDRGSLERHRLCAQSDQQARPGLGDQFHAGSRRAADRAAADHRLDATRKF